MKNPFTQERVCPWWCCWTFDNPIRKIFHKPEEILKPYIRQGQTVADLGCGMGYFSLGMAALVGEAGRVIAVDLQDEMLQRLVRRSEKRGLQSRIQTLRCDKDALGIREPLDFVLAFWMVHEVPNRPKFFAEIFSLLKPDGKFLVVEPKMHTIASRYQSILEQAFQAGFKTEAEPRIALSRAILLAK